MTRFLSIFALLILSDIGSEAATYYVNKVTGDDSRSAATAQNSATPWATFLRPCDSDYVSGNDTIEIMAGSGPYYPQHAQKNSLGYIYLTQSSGITLTWNFHGNTFQGDWNVNDGTYEWHQSSASGKTTWYYLTGDGGTQPQRPATHVAGNLTECFSVIIGTDWNDKDINLVNGAASYKPNNWAWGNYDSLGFSTLYVHMANSLSPSDVSNSSTAIMASNADYIFRVGTGKASAIINDAVLRGQGTDVGPIVAAGAPVQLNRCRLIGARWYGVYFANAGATGSSVNYCLLQNCGHRGVEFSAAVNANIYNCLFDRCHLAIRFVTDASYTVVARNNATVNLYAGGVQKDVATPTFTESNNQWHIDPNSTHGAKAIAFTTATPQWALTAASDIPAATATSDTSGTDPQVSSLGIPLAGSPLRLAGTFLGYSQDLIGRVVLSQPDIGCYQVSAYPFRNRFSAP